MHAVAIPANHHTSQPEILASMFRLRARVFSERLGWNVTVSRGLERDAFDDLNPTYILVAQGKDSAVGCVRLLPAIGPTMLEHIFPQLLSAGSLGSHGAMIETSRFCVDTFAGGRGARNLHMTTLTLLAGIIEWSMANGYDEVVTATDLRFERILNRAGWPMERLGDPYAIGNTIAVAGRLTADPSSFERVCPPGYRSAFEATSATALRSAA